MTDVVESTAVEEGAELVQVDAHAANLFRADSPAEVLERARETADAFRPVVSQHSTMIQGRRHVTVEGWQTLGAMLGITPVCTWTRKLDDGWEARVEARTLDGRVVGAAEAECLRSERQWKSRDDYALRSMAQTRATSKALASPLRFVATLAGAEGTPAEEMPRDEPQSNGKHGFASDKQEGFFNGLLEKAGAAPAQRKLIVAYAKAELTGHKGGTIPVAIDLLEKDPESALDRLTTAATRWSE